MKTALVCGAGGFIGSHLVVRLKHEGYWVRGVDLKHPDFSTTAADEFITGDLRDADFVQAICRDSNEFSYFPQPFENSEPFDEVYQLAADMGGAGYVFTGANDADIMHNSTTINLNVVDVLHRQKFKGKIFYSSSACMYPLQLQDGTMIGERDENEPVYCMGMTRKEWRNGGYVQKGLKESDAYPANPDSEYGWEKLFSERLFLAYARNHSLTVRIARFHNIYGPEGTFEGGREKAPAAICRKVIEAENTMDIWGDGYQTRSFLFIDDCVDAVRLLMKSDYNQPINIGSEEMVTINKLAKMAIAFSGKSIEVNHIEGPTGVRGRNSDNTVILNVLNWEPKFSLHEGLFQTYNWIASRING